MKIHTLRERLEGHADALRAMGLAALYLFGSRAQALSGPQSDYDFGILLNRRLPPGSKRKILYDQLYALFDSLIGEPTNIDIVFLHDAPIHLRQHVIRHGKILFETDPLVRGRFHEQTMTESADFEFHRKRFEAETLKRIS